MSATIYTSSDSRYFPGLMALLNSIRHYGVDLPVVVSDMGLTPEQRTWTETKARVVPGWKPRPDSTASPDYRAFQSKAENVRMNYDGNDIVFLDSDVILCDDIRDMLPGALAKFDLVVLKDIFQNEWSQVHTAVVPGLPAGCQGFGCGQYAMSKRIAPAFLDRWCDLQVELLKRVPHSRIKFGPDQEAYNMMLYTMDIKKLLMTSPVWYQHMMQEELCQPGRAVVGLSDKGRQQLRFPEYDCSAKLIHFASHGKPWTSERGWHPAASLKMFDHMLAMDLLESDNPKLAADALLSVEPLKGAQT